MHLLRKYDNQKKSADSCEAMYDKYGSLLFRICYSILLNRDDAEDAVHEVFCKYIVKRPEFSEPEHEKAWFIRVASNQCKDMLRRKKVRNTVSLDEIAEFSIAPKESDVLAQVFSLEEKYRTVILMHYFEDCSVHQIAEFFELSESAVKMRLARGREMLKTLLT